MSDLLNNLTYQEAMEQLNNLLERMERGEIEIDQLEASIEKAKDLVKFCEQRLRNIESKLDNS